MEKRLRELIFGRKFKNENLVGFEMSGDDNNNGREEVGHR